MTNQKNNLSNQQTIFDWIKKAEELSSQTKNPPAGSLNIDAEFRAAISEDIKNCPFSRYQITAQISELTGEEITINMLYNWTAESHEGHRFPCQFLPAFVIATGGRRAFEVLSRKSGLFALPGPEALRAEIQKLEEDIKNKHEEKRKRMIFLKELQNGR